MPSQIVEGFSLSHAQVLDGATPFLTALATLVADTQDIYGVSDSSIDPDVGDYDNEGDDVVLSSWSWFNFADVSIQAGYLSFPLIASLTGASVGTIAAVVGVNEVNSLIATGATAGTFTMTVNGQTTAAIPYNATAAQVQAALRLLSPVGVGVTCSGGPLPTTAVVITWSGSMGGRDLTLSANSTGLTGGTAAVTTTTPGVNTSPAAIGMDLWHEDSFNTAPKPMVVKVPSKDHLGVACTLAIGLYKVQFRPITFDGPSYKDGLKVNYAGRAVMSATDEVGAAFADGKKRAARVLSYV